MPSTMTTIDGMHAFLLIILQEKTMRRKIMLMFTGVIGMGIFLSFLLGVGYGTDTSSFMNASVASRLNMSRGFVMLTINAMTTADSVLVPIQCEYYALEGLSQLIHTVELVKDRLNEKLEIEGVVFTMYDARTNLSLQVVENVKDNLQQNIYKTIIPRNIRLAEAPSYGMPINKYDSKSAGCDSYMRLADEVMNRDVS